MHVFKSYNACSLHQLIYSYQDHFYEIEAHQKKHDPLLHIEVYDYDILSSSDLLGEMIL